MEIVASLIKLFFGSKADKDRKADRALPREDQGGIPFDRSPFERRAARPEPGAEEADRRFHRPRRGATSCTLKAQTGTAPKPRSKRRRSISKEIDEIDQTHRREDRTKARRNPARSVRHHEGYGAPFRTERRDGHGHGQRFRPAAGRLEGFRHVSTATRPSMPTTGWRAATTSNGTWSITTCSCSAAWCSTRARSPRWRRAKERPSWRRSPYSSTHWPSKGVHMVTVNNYLAKRDSEWMGPMYQFHGLSVACIDDTQPNSDARRKAYMADITFGTNNEYGFDYLRDNMASSPADLVQRKHHFAIVDEVDSVLIDDARTPLIISGPVPKGDDQLFEQYCPAIDASLQPAEKPRDGPAGRGTPAYLGGQERRGRREALPCPQGPAQVQAADQIPLGNGRQGADAEDREHLHAGQQPPYAGDHRRPVLRHRRKTQLGGTDRQGTRGAVEIFQRGRVLRAARHRRRGGRAGKERTSRTRSVRRSATRWSTTIRSSRSACTRSTSC